MKYDVSIKMIENGFHKAAEKGLIDEDTAKKYSGCIKNFVTNHLSDIQANATTNKERNVFNPSFWNGKLVDGWFEKLVDRYNSGDLSADYVQNSAMAFQKMQELQRENKIFDKNVPKYRVGETGSIKEQSGRLYELHLAGVSKSNDDVTVIKPKDDTELIKIRDHLEKTLPEKTAVQQKNKESIIGVLTAQIHTGGRLGAELNLKAGDVNLETLEKHYEKDKNSFSRTVPFSESVKAFYESKTKDKPKGSFLFPILKADGKQLSIEESQKRVEDAVRDAARETGVNYLNEKGKEVRYTPHSNRRAYAQQLYDSTKFKSKNDLRKMIGEYVNRQGSNKEKILDRIEKEKDRLNWYRIKNGLEKKDFSHEQLRRLVVALHLGHSRIDHISRYIETDQNVWNK